MSSSFCFYLFILICIYPVFSSSSTPSADTDTYTQHCSSIVPQSSPTVHADENLLPFQFTSYYFTGGDRLLRRKPGNHTYYRLGKYLRLRISRNYYQTIADGIYKIEAFLYIRSSYRYNDNSYGNGSRYRMGKAGGSIRFSLKGFWSGISRKLCMVGSASWKFEQGKPLNLDAVLKLNFATKNPNIYTSLVTGTLDSTGSADDPGYFDTIFIFDFPLLIDYNYSLVSKELLGTGGLSSDFEVPKSQSLHLQPIMFCSVLSGKPIYLELEYDAKECREDDSDRHCSPFVADGGLIGTFLPRFLLLKPIQCTAGERKLRYMATFQNISYAVDEDFSLDSTVIGEASWDDTNNQLSGVLCRILNPVKHSGKAVGDCTMRWILRYPSIWTIQNDAKIGGQFWSTQAVEDPGYFRKINLKSADDGDGVALPGLRYEYTELDRVRKLCPVKKLVKKGNTYPDGHSYDMRFDMSVTNSKGEKIGWGFASPLSVGNDLYDRNSMIAVESMAPESASTQFAQVSDAEISTINTSSLNISYRITINNFAPNLQTNHLEITAEGVYDAKAGYLCMVACRKLANYTSRDCEILVKLDFSPLNEMRGGLVKGTIESTRAKTDTLHFKDMSFSSAAYYSEMAVESIWRMDLEITMVLISNTLSCIFVMLQIFHVRRNPEVRSCISLGMLVILSLGHMVPLVLNFEALFSEKHNKQAVLLSTGGWLEANEVTVRVITMIAFLLEIRLVQLVWNAKGNEKSSSTGEKMAAFVSLPLYITGGLLTLLINWTRNRYGHKPVNPYQKQHTDWGDLRSYAGLILDGFLLPQIILNAVRGSTEKVLSYPFYIGTSAVRLVPHAYDQYRAHNYPVYGVNTTYLYANPSADFYSTAWDAIIPFGVIVLALIVFLQQCRGGRCILPQRFREM